jgi:tetratricopeptide (TPR) repeat protein
MDKAEAAGSRHRTFGWRLLAAGIVLSGILAMWGLAARSSRLSREYSAQGQRFRALPPARLAARLWPTMSNRLDLAEALLCQADAAPRREGEAILAGLDAKNRRLPARAYYLLAVVALRRGEYERATVIVRDRLATNPESPELWCAQAQILAAQRNWEAALTAYDRALAAARAVPGGYGEVYLLHWERVAAANALGDWRRAMAVAQEAAVAYPQDPMWWSYYAEFAEYAGEWELAAKTRERTVEASGGAPGLTYLACHLLGRMRQASRGERLLKHTGLSPFQRHYCLAALYCFASPPRARQELSEAQHDAATELETQRATLMLAASWAWEGQVARSLAELSKVRSSATMGMYARLYALQAQMLLSPAKGRAKVVAYAQSLRDQSSWRWARECEQILAPGGLRMPRASLPQGDHPSTGDASVSGG